MKTGTQIEVAGINLAGERTWEAAKIIRTTRRMLPLPQGFHPVRFASGGCLLVHKDGFRVVSQPPASHRSRARDTLRQVHNV